MRWVALILVCVLAGCASPKRQISYAATEAHQAAQEIVEVSESSEARFEVVEDTEGVGEQQVIQAKAEQIKGAVNTVQGALPGVEDKPGFFDRIGNLLMRFFWAIIIVGVVIVLWQTGAGYLLKRLAWSIGWFIPKKTRTAARLDMEAIDTQCKTTPREAVAAKRADPAYSAAVARIKRRQRELPR